MLCIFNAGNQCLCFCSPCPSIEVQKPLTMCSCKTDVRWRCENVTLQRSIFDVTPSFAAFVCSDMVMQPCFRTYAGMRFCSA